eukprot:gnl/Spiro4/12940_TR6860_c0_g1_i1.p1 gnl/Spiro4/12940_TR6860_c0_g1~~gnl/Spiro4/12940_TR6860_c0_g1_i1.p1  ORF type:complete len:366 (+),score=88.04 gnl/Spiro4/12940_TR6860_c0_g1_i1:35-1132(+)
MATTSSFTPTFWRQLTSPTVSTILICGCGGGFDFVHSMLLYRELRELGKTIVICAYSFVEPNTYSSSETVPCPVVWPLERDDTARCATGPSTVVKVVRAGVNHSPYYAPEHHVASFLDSRFPDTSPHTIYACNARAFTPDELTAFYTKLVTDHNVDAICVLDGGSDSLMAGDESGLGDPIEDAVTVSAVASVACERLQARVVLSAGFGSDRFNGVTDAASLRAVAEMSKLGGFLGSVSMEPQSRAVEFYRSCVEHIYRHQSFRSVLTGMVLSAAAGEYGHVVPENSASRDTDPRTCYVWPLMACLFGFDARVLHRRSLTARWIAGARSVREMYERLDAGRRELEASKRLRPMEELPHPKLFQQYE